MAELLINASTSYTVEIGQGIIGKLADKIAELGNYNKVAVVADSNVAELYLESVIKTIAEKFCNVYSYIFVAGEESKNIQVLSNIYDFMAEKELTRTDIVIALGGGVTGDMVGFASATYLRGIDYINIPTTLLAMVDSSVGGKTAVNIASGKNLVGAFKQPKYVLCDIDFLKTLDDGLIADGIGEIAKYAVLDDRGLFELLSEPNLESNYLSIIEKCIAIKADYVTSDEYDKGKRQMLNLGHTLAHVIEKDCNYNIHHGKAVLIGMYLLTAKYNFSTETQDILNKLNAVAKRFNMDISYSKSADVLWSMAGNDKKRSGDYITIVRPYGIGDCRLEKVAANCPLNYSEAVMKNKYDVEIFNSGLKGEIIAPPSKSHAHRLLIASAVTATKDRSIAVNNVLFNVDVSATLEALTALGFIYDISGNCVTFKGSYGLKQDIVIDCRECGSTLRFFIPLCAMLGVNTTFIGSKTLGERGYLDIIDALKTIKFDRTSGLPLKTSGKYDDNNININGKITSQFVSGLLLGAMATHKKLTINIDNEISSKSYIDITAEVIKQFGGNVEWTNNTCTVDCKSMVNSKQECFEVESDYSNGAFFNVAGIDVVYNNPNSVQGDKAILNLIENGKTHGYIDYDIKNTPDLMPILSVFAATLKGKSIIRNCARLRLKECNRLEVMQEILSKCGVNCEIIEDNLLINGGCIAGGVEVDSCNDHRIAMATAILATYATNPIKLTNAQTVSKSYPQFWEDFAKLGGVFNVINIR